MVNWTAGDKITAAKLNQMAYSTPASYVVYKDGSTYYADACFSGGTSYEDPDAATVIQNAIDALEGDTTVRHIHIKEGAYPITTKLTWQQYYLMMTGDGRKTRLYADTGLSTTLLEVEETYSVGWIKHLMLDGNGESAKVLDLSRSATTAKWFSVESCVIEGGTTSSVDVTKREEAYFRNCYIGSTTNTSTNTFYANGMDGYLMLDNCTIVGGTTASLHYSGVQLRANQCQFAADPATAAAVNVYLAEYTSIPYVYLTNCHFEQEHADHYALKASTSATKPSLFAVNTFFNNAIKGGFTQMSLMNCHVSASATYANTLDIDALSNGIWGSGRFNKGFNVVAAGKYHVFDTENMEWISNMYTDGTATILNGQTKITVTHGLATTPTYVVATGSTADTNALYVDNRTATQFDINAAGAVGGDRIVNYTAACW